MLIIQHENARPAYIYIYYIFLVLTDKTLSKPAMQIYLYYYCMQSFIVNHLLVLLLYPTHDIQLQKIHISFSVSRPGI